MATARCLIARTRCRGELSSWRTLPGEDSIRSRSACRTPSGTASRTRSMPPRSHGPTRPSRGRAGRAAFLELLSLGMSRKANCGDGPNGFDRVIGAGERALRAGAKEPEVHHYLGLAYADVVALARGAGDEYADSSEFRPRAA